MWFICDKRNSLKLCCYYTMKSLNFLTYFSICHFFISKPLSKANKFKNPQQKIIFNLFLSLLSLTFLFYLSHFIYLCFLPYLLSTLSLYIYSPLLSLFLYFSFSLSPLHSAPSVFTHLFLSTSISQHYHLSLSSLYLPLYILFSYPFSTYVLLQYLPLFLSLPSFS